MIKFDTFKKICRSRNFDYAIIQEIGKNDIISVDNIYISQKSKRVYFNNEDGKAVLNPIFRLTDIELISRETTKSENDYIFLMFLKDDRIYRIKIFMREGYTPFIRNEKCAENNKIIAEEIPKFLDTIKGKTIEICRTDHSEIFSIYDLNSDCELHTTSEKHIINDFDYEMMMLCNMPCIKMYESGDSREYSTILYVSLITANQVSYDNGVLKKADNIIISANNGSYCLNVLNG